MKEKVFHESSQSDENIEVRNGASTSAVPDPFIPAGELDKLLISFNDLMIEAYFFIARLNSSANWSMLSNSFVTAKKITISAYIIL